MFKFLHAADIHLDSPLQKLERYEGAPVEELRQATRRALQGLIELAIDQEVDFVLLCGDLYDGDWKDYNTGLYFISQISKLQKANIPVYIISGNHDAANKMTKTLKLPEGVHLLPSNNPQTIFLDQLGVAIHGLGFAAPVIRQDLSVSYPKAIPGYFNIGLLHTCAMGREGHDPYAPCTLEGLKSKGYDYWALGHIHQREILAQNPLIIFPGNIQGRHIRETGSKGCMLVTCQDSGQVTTDFHSLDVLRWERCKVGVTGAETSPEVIDRLLDHLAILLESNEGLPLATRIEITGACPAHAGLMANPERLMNEVRSVAIEAGGGRLWIEKIKLLTTSPPDQDELLELSEGPIGELLHVLKEISYDPKRLQGLGLLLSDLWKKLPLELKEGDKIMAMDDPNWLAGVLDRIKPLLLQRIRQPKAD